MSSSLKSKCTGDWKLPSLGIPSDWSRAWLRNLYIIISQGICVDKMSLFKRWLLCGHRSFEVAHSLRPCSPHSSSWNTATTLTLEALYKKTELIFLKSQCVQTCTPVGTLYPQSLTTGFMLLLWLALKSEYSYSITFSTWPYQKHSKRKWPMLK